MLKKIFLNESFIIFLIIFNAIVIFIDGFKLQADFQNWLEVIDHTFTAIFTLEIITKLQHYGWKKYWESNWNKFDFYVVIASLPAFFIFIFGWEGFHFHILLALRVARVLKSFRFLKFVPNLNQLFEGLQRAVKASFIVLITYFIFNFIVAIISCTLFGNILPEHFGNPLNSFYSVFKVFTIEGWFEIPEELAAKMGTIGAIFTKLWFMMILVVGGLLGLSLVNSIFVDAMVQDNNDAVEAKIDIISKQIEEIRDSLKKS